MYYINIPGTNEYCKVLIKHNSVLLLKLPGKVEIAQVTSVGAAPREGWLADAGGSEAGCADFPLWEGGG
jgi:hypothetical protein